MAGMAHFHEISRWTYLVGTILFVWLFVRHLVILGADYTAKLWLILAIFFVGFYLRELRSVKRTSN
jgi:hypothetical protein